MLGVWIVDVAKTGKTGKFVGTARRQCSLRRPYLRY